jgi:hypothetical protein
MNIKGLTENFTRIYTPFFTLGSPVIPTKTSLQPLKIKGFVFSEKIFIEQEDLNGLHFELKMDEEYLFYLKFGISFFVSVVFPFVIGDVFLTKSMFS